MCAYGSNAKNALILLVCFGPSVDIPQHQCSADQDCLCNDKDKLRQI